MKKTILPILATALFLTSANAQTSPFPNPSAQSSCGIPLPLSDTNKLIPDTAQFRQFYYACAGSNYETYFRFAVPTDTNVTVSGTTTRARINYFNIDDVTGMPAGFNFNPFEYQMGMPVAADAKFNGGESGCIKLSTVGNVTAAPGTYTVTIKVTANVTPNSSPFAINYPVTFQGFQLVVKSASQCTQGVEEAIAKNSIFVAGNYPNPFENTTTFKVSVPTDQRITLNVYNTLGQLVRTQNQSVIFGENLIKFDGSDLANGIYSYTMVSDKAGVLTANGMLSIAK